MNGGVAVAVWMARIQYNLNRFRVPLFVTSHLHLVVAIGSSTYLWFLAVLLADIVSPVRRSFTLLRTSALETARMRMGLVCYRFAAWGWQCR